MLQSGSRAGQTVIKRSRFSWFLFRFCLVFNECNTLCLELCQQMEKLQHTIWRLNNHPISHTCTGHNMPVPAARNTALVPVHIFRSTCAFLTHYRPWGKQCIIQQHTKTFLSQNNTLVISAKISCFVSKLKLTTVCADTYVGDRGTGRGLCMTKAKTLE